MTRSSPSRPSRKHPHYLSESSTMVLLAGLALAGATLPSPAFLYGADILPAGALATKSSGRVISNESLSSGQIAAGLTIDGANDTFAGGTEDHGIRAQRTHQATVNMSLGLLDRLELGLGIKGTDESMDAKDRRSLFGNGTIDDQVTTSDDGAVSAPGRAVNGAVGSLKLAISHGPIFKISVLGFAEGGAGSGASLVLSRSGKPKAGWMLVTSVGEKGVAELTLNGGMRYRDPEQLGEVMLRHEQLFAASLKGYLTKNASLFGAYEARRLMVAQVKEGEDLSYHLSNSAMATAGLSADFGKASWSVYGGKSVGKEVLGDSKSLVGLSVEYRLGRVWGNHSGERLMADQSPESSKQSGEAAKESSPGAGVADQKPSESTVYLDPEGKPIDVYRTDDTLKSADGDDDFDMFRAQALKQKGAGPSVEQKAEEELIQLRAAEAKVDAEKAKVREEAQRIQKLEEKESSRRNLEKAQKYRNEVKGEVEKIEGVGSPDVEWDGLGQ